jgi:hypothetical protein
VIQFKNVPHGSTVLAAALFPHVRDSHLYLVLVELPGGFATWACKNMSYNIGDYQSIPNSEQFNGGVYEKAKARAYASFLERLKLRVDQFMEAYKIHA